MLIDLHFRSLYWTGLVNVLRSERDVASQKQEEHLQVTSNRLGSFYLFPREFQALMQSRLELNTMQRRLTDLGGTARSFSSREQSLLQENRNLLQRLDRLQIDGQRLQRARVHHSDISGRESDVFPDLVEESSSPHSTLQRSVRHNDQKVFLIQL